MSRPQSFCMVPRNLALRLEFSLLALTTDKDSRRTRGPKLGPLTGSFSANQRKRPDPDNLLSVMSMREAGTLYRGCNDRCHLI